MMKHRNKKIYHSLKELYRIHKLDKIDSEVRKIASEFCILIYSLKRKKDIFTGHCGGIENEIISFKLNIFNELILSIETYYIIIHKYNGSYKVSMVVEKKLKDNDYIINCIPTTEFYKEFRNHFELYYDDI